MKMISVLQSLQQGIVICDTQGRVVYINGAYASFAGISPEDVYGKKLKDVRVGSLVPKVLKTGKAIEGIYKYDGEQNYFANIYPIYEAGACKGTISIITTLEQSKAQKIARNKTLKERVREFERQEIQNMLLVHEDSLEGKKKAAKALGISLSTLYSKLESNE